MNSIAHRIATGALRSTRVRSFPSRTPFIRHDTVSQVRAKCTNYMAVHHNADMETQLFVLCRKMEELDAFQAETEKRLAKLEKRMTKLEVRAQYLYGSKPLKSTAELIAARYNEGVHTGRSSGLR